MIALQPSDFAVAPDFELGDRALRLPSSRDRDDGFLAPDGRTLWISTQLGVAEIDLAAWGMRRLHRAPELAGATCTKGLAGGQRLVTRSTAGVVLWSPETSTVLAVGDAFAVPGRLVAPPDSDDAVLDIVHAAVRRWRRAGRELRHDGSFQRPAPRESFGYELRHIVFDARGELAYVQSDRDVLCIDAQSLELRAVCFDIDAHHKNPRAWLDVATLCAVQVHGDALFALANRNGGRARLYQCSLRDGSSRELELPADMALHCLSPVLANGTLLVGGLSGVVAVDAARFAVTEVLRGFAAYFQFVDRASCRAHAWLTGGAFATLDAAPRLRATTREGERIYSALRWGDAHVVALCSQRGIDRYAPPAPIPELLPETQTIRPGRLSAGGRWALLYPSENVARLQHTGEPPRRRDVALGTDATTSHASLAVSDDGTLWHWTGHELRSESGARVELARRETWGAIALSRSGQYVALTMPREIVVVDARTLARRCAVAAPKRASATFAGDDVLVVSGADGVRWFDAGTGSLLQWYKRRIEYSLGVVVSPDGSHVVLRCGGATMELVSRDAPDRAARFTAGMGAHDAAFSPDGSQLVVASEESVLRVFSVEALARSAGDAAKKPRARRGAVQRGG